MKMASDVCYVLGKCQSTHSVELASRKMHRFRRFKDSGDAASFDSGSPVLRVQSTSGFQSLVHSQMFFGHRPGDSASTCLVSCNGAMNVV